MVDDVDAAYDRGVAAGAIDEKLREYGRHFDRINGSIDTNTAVLNNLLLAVQQLRDQAESRDATILATAKALKEASEARRETTERTWSPWQKVIAVVGGLAALAGVIAFLIR